MFINIKVVPRPNKSQLKKVPLPQKFFDNDFPSCKIGSSSEFHFAKDLFDGKI